LKELIDHIFELAQNSIKAHALNIYLGVFEEPQKNAIRIIVEDDGKGIKKEDLPKIIDPFYTKRESSKRKVGIGIPFLYQNCKEAGGELKITSQLGKGTKVEAIMQYYHIDRAPLGDLIGVFFTILSLEEHNVSWTIEHRINRIGYKRTIERIRKDIGVDSFKTKSAMNDLKDYLVKLESRFEIKR
jgi:hypothetical protein